MDNSQAMKHESLRRAIETCSHSIKTICEAGKHNDLKVDDDLIVGLQSTIKTANNKLKNELTEIK